LFDMIKFTKTIRANIIIRNKNVIRIALVTAFILLIPLVVMQFSDEVAWNLTDFATIGVLLFGTGLLYELAARKTRNIKYRAAIGIALAAAFILIWLELAVGIFGTPFSGS
jgi:peptidoglycan/LPS O-acetylase OafA/YrhL